MTEETEVRVRRTGRLIAEGLGYIVLLFFLVVGARETWNRMGLANELVETFSNENPYAFNTQDVTPMSKGRR